MPSRIASRCAAAVLLLALGTPAPRSATDDRAADPAPPEAHHEVPDQPPARVERDRMARSPSTVVVRGGHISVQVNVDAAGHNIVGDAANEPSMAVDPTDPANIVVGWRQFDTVVSNFRQAGYAYSRDGGASWTFPGVLQPGQFRSDPVLDADADGAFYYYSLSTVSSVEMFISNDKGLSWLGPFPAFGGDKEWMIVDATTGPGAGHVYTLWNSLYTCCAPGTDFTRSIDGGFMYQGPYAMPVKVMWGTLDVAADGTLFVVGTDVNSGSTTDHHVLRSSNALDPTQVPVFEGVFAIDLGGVTVAGGPPNPGGLLGQVWIAADTVIDPEAGGVGNVYVLASVDPPGPDPLDVNIIRSDDRGESWSPPIKVNDEPPGGIAYQWFGALSVAPDGRLDATWYDTRNHPTARISEVYYAYSKNGGRSWSAGIPVSPPFDSTIGYPNQNKLGDYTHMISDERGALLAYAATFNGEQDVWVVRVGDCNQNGVHDSIDLASGTSVDCNHNGQPDECEEGLGEICDDGVDNDCNGLIDCSDPACIDDPACECNFNTICELGEDCYSCPSDCASGPTGCGNGVCETTGGEDCLTCPGDCAGLQSGNPNNQFCCGDPFGAGNNPVGCIDPRCNEGGFVCVKDYVPGCCGDLQCEADETPCLCELDCGAFSPSETACYDAIDNDCDGAVDCDDDDCSAADTTPPAGVPRLRVDRNAGGIVLRWEAPAGAVSFDVVEGDLGLLAGDGDFTLATTSCVADDLDAIEIGTTAGGADRWYLVRPAFCLTGGSYDTGSSAQLASRDAPIDASPAACP